MQRNYFLIIGAVLGSLAVILGAFGVHGLEKVLDPALLDRYQTGVTYHFYHTLALLVIALLWEKHPSSKLKFSGLCFIIGTLLFSGSLYLYAVTGIKSFGMITPIGGSAFILGWSALAWYGWQQSPSCD